MSEKKIYIVAMLRLERDWWAGLILDTSKRYTLQEAADRARELNRTQQCELKALGYHEFVVYNSETNTVTYS
jgi:hypothetical protein